jgi:hypothetical protein
MLNEQCVHQSGLLLLHPMSGAIVKMESDHMCAGTITHLVDSTPRLIDAPIFFARDELRGDVYGAPRKDLHFSEASGIGAPPHRYPCNAPVKLVLTYSVAYTSISASVSHLQFAM